MSWEDVTLPDGVKLAAVLQPGGAAPQPVARMPNGTRPSEKFGFGWWSTVFKASIPKFSLPVFSWTSGAKLPTGCQCLMASEFLRLLSLGRMALW